MVGGLVSVTVGIVYDALDITPPGVWLMLLGMTMLVIGVIAAERRVFHEAYNEFGNFLAGRRDEPSRLRYLGFLDQLRRRTEIDSQDVIDVIPSFESRINYRQSFLTRYPILTLNGIIVGILTTAGLSHPALWAPPTPIGLYLLALSVVLWLVLIPYSRMYRDLRPSRETQERELVTFLHLAAMDLKQPAGEQRPAEGPICDTPEKSS
jgi:hypothetical protein